MAYQNFYGGWRPYIPVAERRRRALAHARALRASGVDVRPIEVGGRKITRTFWGDAWCRNLEHYSDFHNRLPRGRTYVRNGSVFHLAIGAGCVDALVSGSDIYEVRVEIARTPVKAWKALVKECTGQIDSLVDLLKGRLAQGVMERICRPKTGLFPTPKQIDLECSCPDWARMCKHVAAVLYGIGCRLDHEPELLFLLRGVDAGELIAEAAGKASGTAKTPAPENALADTDDMGALFGIEIEGGPSPAPKPRKRRPKKKAAARKKGPKRKTAPRKKPARAKTGGTTAAKNGTARKKNKSGRKKSAARKKTVAASRKTKSAPAKKKAAGGAKKGKVAKKIPARKRKAPRRRQGHGTV